MSVHCKSLAPALVSELCDGVVVSPLQQPEDVPEFRQCVLQIVANVKLLEVCVGADHKNERIILWKEYDHAYIDFNPFQETRFVKTLRSNECALLVKGLRVLRCKACAKLSDALGQRKLGLDPGDFNPSTPNENMTKDQLKAKVNWQQKTNHSLKVAVNRVQEKVSKCVDQNTLPVGQDMSSYLSDIIMNSSDLNLSEEMRVFLDHQIKASAAKGPSGVRWHPTMIRFALHLKMKKTAAYKALRASGFIKLPAERTLYDYTHVVKNVEGPRGHIIEKISCQVREMPHKYQKHHVMCFDEVYVPKKLVLEKHTGEIMGYVDFDSVTQEMEALDSFMKGNEVDDRPPMATKMLCFMLKGVASDVKDVVASYAVNNVSKEVLFEKT